MSTEPTGGDWSGFPGAVSLDPAGYEASSKSGSRCESYEVPGARSADDRVTGGSQSITTERREYTRVPGRFRDDAIALKRLLKATRDAAKSLCEAAESDDPIEKAIIGFELKAQLQRVWEYRHVHNEDWQEALNSLQCALGGLKFESVTCAQAECLSFIIFDKISGGDLAPSDATDVRVRLRKCGLDPWGSFSAKDE